MTAETFILFGVPTLTLLVALVGLRIVKLQSRRFAEREKELIALSQREANDEFSFEPHVARAFYKERTIDRNGRVISAEEHDPEHGFFAGPLGSASGSRRAS